MTRWIDEPMRGRRGMKQLLAALILTLTARVAGAQAAAPALAPLDSLYPDLEKLYLDLHQTPELSNHEEKTSAKMAARLKALGYEVTTGVGGYGVVAILKNGTGPTVLLREDMDALPVEERTGLAYASKVTTKDDSGATVSVMHAPREGEGPLARDALSRRPAGGGEGQRRDGDDQGRPLHEVRKARLRGLLP
jgi:hypothetical protein